jgi:hypothetical protein
MPVLTASGPFLSGLAAGFVLGAALVSAGCTLLGHRHQQVRRRVLGGAARALADALGDLERDGDLGPHAYLVCRLHALAAAVARAEED